jgi:hypothetical protein
MSSAADARAGGSYVEFYLKGEAAVKAGIARIGDGMKRLSTVTATVAAGLAASSALVTAPLVRGLGVLSEWGSETASTMRETGLSLSEFNTLSNGLRVSGEHLVPALGAMSSVLEQAANGSIEARQRFDTLGLSLDELLSFSQGERALRIADAISRLGDAGQRVAMLRGLFSERGAAFNIEGGRAGIEGRTSRVADLQGDALTSPASLAAARQYNEAFRELTLAQRGFFASLGLSVSPIVTNAIQGITEIIVAARQWIDSSRDVVAFVGATAVAVGGLASGLFGVAAVVRGVSAALAFLSPLLAIVKSGFGLLTIASGAWSVASTIAGAAFTAFSMAYAAGQAVIQGATWAYNAVVGIATGATGGFSIALAIASVWEAIATAGVTALVAALGALAIALGAFAALAAGATIAAVAVSYLGIRFGELNESLSFLDDAVDWIMGVVTATRDWVAEMWQAFTVGTEIGRALADGFHGIRAALEPITTAVRNTFTNVANFVGGIVGPMFANISGTAREAATGLAQAFSAAWLDIRGDGVAAFRGIVDALMTGRWEDLWTLVKLNAQIAFLDIKGLAGEAWVNIKFLALGTWAELWGAAVELAMGAWTELKVLWEGVLDVLDQGWIGWLLDVQGNMQSTWFNIAETILRTWARIESQLIASSLRIARSALAAGVLGAGGQAAINRIAGEQSNNDLTNAANQFMGFGTQQRVAGAGAEQIRQQAAQDAALRRQQLELEARRRQIDREEEIARAQGANAPDLARLRGERDIINDALTRLRQEQDAERNRQQQPGGNQREETGGQGSTMGTFQAAAAMGWGAGLDLQQRILAVNVQQLGALQQIADNGVMAIARDVPAGDFAAPDAAFPAVPVAADTVADLLASINANAAMQVEAQRIVGTQIAEDNRNALEVLGQMRDYLRDIRNRPGITG